MTFSRPSKKLSAMEIMKDKPLRKHLYIEMDAKLLQTLHIKAREHGQSTKDYVTDILTKIIEKNK